MDELMKVIFQTEVGSRMWGMAELSSDHDLFTVYQEPTKSFLSGCKIDETKPMVSYVKNNEEYDEQFMEIGHLINLLCKGNVNALWGVTSPLVYTCFPELIKITKENCISHESYNSIRGLVISQQKDSIKRANTRLPEKSLKTAYRTAQFGIELLTYGTLNYRPNIPKEVTYELVDYKLKELDESYVSSDIQDKPNEDALREFLYELRIGDLNVV